MGSQGYHEWTPFSTLDFGVVSLTVHADSKKHHKAVFWAGSVGQGGRKKLGEKGKEGRCLNQGSRLLTHGAGAGHHQALSP